MIKDVFKNRHNVMHIKTYPRYKVPTSIITEMVKSLFLEFALF